MGNFFKTVFLLSFLGVLLIVAGRVLAGNQGMFLALIFSLGLNLGFYFFSDQIALKMNKAKPASKKDYPQLYQLVSQLTRKANLPLPKIYVSPNPQPNAFAAGRDPQHAVVCVTQGLVDSLSLEEIKGVLAHELAHIKNRDTLIATIAAVMASLIAWTSQMFRFSVFFGGSEDEDRPSSGLAFLFAFLAPLAATLIQLAISRTREFGADASAVKMAQEKEGLISALKKLQMAARGGGSFKINPAFSSLYIVNPFSGEKALSLFSTHPPVSERIKRLEKMAV